MTNKLIKSDIKTTFYISQNNFVETPRKVALAKLSIRKVGSSLVLIILFKIFIIDTDEHPSLRVEGFAILNLRGVNFPQNYYILLAHIQGT